MHDTKKLVSLHFKRKRNKNSHKKTQMTKADIINKIATSTGIPKKDVAVVVESLMETIKNSLLEKKRMFICVASVVLLSNIEQLKLQETF